METSLFILFFFLCLKSAQAKGSKYDGKKRTMKMEEMYKYKEKKRTKSEMSTQKGKKKKKTNEEMDNKEMDKNKKKKKKRSWLAGGRTIFSTIHLFPLFFCIFSPIWEIRFWWA